MIDCTDGVRLKETSLERFGKDGIFIVSLPFKPGTTVHEFGFWAALGMEHSVHALFHLIAGRARRECDVEAVLTVCLGKAVRCVECGFRLALAHRGFDEETTSVRLLLEKKFYLALHRTKRFPRKHREEFLDGLDAIWERGFHQVIALQELWQDALNEGDSCFRRDGMLRDGIA